MSTYRLSDPFIQKYDANTGDAGVGYKLYFYVGGSTTTLQDTYSDVDGLVPNTNPVVADSDGLFPDIYLSTNLAYACKLTDEDDAQISYAPYIQQSSSPVAVVASTTVEVKAGADFSARAVTLANRYTLGTGNLHVFRNGQRLNISADYTETATNSITLTFDPVALDTFTFINGTFTTSSTVSSYAAIVETKTGADFVGNVVSITNAFTPGTNSVLVFKNGVYQTLTADYSETTSTSITTVVTPDPTDNYTFFVGLVASGAASANSLLVSYTPPGAGAVTTNVSAQLDTLSSLKYVASSLNLSGDFTISDTDTTSAVLFSEAEPDALYYIFIQPYDSSGTPAAGAFTITDIARTTTGFTATVSAAPGSGNSVSYSWLMVRYG